MGSVEDIYDIGEELGRGSFSTVHVGVNKKTQEKVAIKIIEKKLVGASLMTEVDILQKVRHPNIIALKDLFDTPKKLYLVMELVTGGELFDKIVAKGSYSERDASVIVAQILSAVAYLHEQKIAHRDLKPENLLLASESTDTEVKLADFGLSKIIGNNVMMQTACGTPSYVAPEVLKASGYGEEVDLWSVGVIMYILLCGYPPFYSENITELFEKIMRADYEFADPYWTDISTEAKELIRKLLVEDPKQRLSAKQALDHAWISKNAAPTKLLKYTGEQLTKFNSQRKIAVPK